MSLDTVSTPAMHLQETELTLSMTEQLRDFIASVTLMEAPETSVRRTFDGAEEIIFETTLDGVCYRLTRSHVVDTSAHVSLSPRELAIAQLIAKGLPNKTIGDILEISPWTVATHLRRIFGKLGVVSRAAMVARLVEENVL